MRLPVRVEYIPIAFNGLLGTGPLVIGSWGHGDGTRGAIGWGWHATNQRGATAGAAGAC